MAECKKIRIPDRKYCIGDLKNQVVLYNRSILEPELGGVDYSENFEKQTTVYAAVKTVQGVTIFDQSNIERIVTHDIGIRYIEGVTQETWLDLNGNRLDIIDVENLDERNEWLRLRCTVRGVNTVETNFA